MIEHGEAFTAEHWEALRDGEDDPFDVGDSGLQWRKKTHHTLRHSDGRLVAHVGLVVVDVEAGAQRFPVAGVGGVIVTHTERGRGHLRPTLEAALERAATLGPERAMLFCSERNAEMYAHFGFLAVEAPVIVEQPAGPHVMPPMTMWRPLRDGVTWPVGLVSLSGLPF